MSLEELRSAMKTKKLVFGANKTIKNLKAAKTKTVFLASNCSKDIEDNIIHYAKMSDAKIIKLDKARSEISVFCKKNFPVSVISC